MDEKVDNGLTSTWQAVWLSDCMSDQPADSSSSNKNQPGSSIDWRWVWLDWLSVHGGMTFAALIIGVVLAFLADIWIGLVVTGIAIALVLGAVVIRRRAKKGN